MKQTRYHIFFTSLILLLLVENSFSQILSFDVGTSRSFTPIRTSEFTRASTYALTVPKNGLFIGLGFEYLQKPKSSFYSEVSFYQCGAKMEDYNVYDEGPGQIWDLVNREYSYNRIGISTNHNMKVWQWNHLSLQAVAGIHLDYLLYSTTVDEDYILPRASDDPLRMLSRYGALRKFTVGPNLGARLCFKKDRFSYYVTYINAPRWFKMGKYEREIDGLSLYGINGITAEEKVSFITFGIGYNLKQEK